MTCISGGVQKPPYMPSCMHISMCACVSCRNVMSCIRMCACMYVQAHIHYMSNLFISLDLPLWRLAWCLRVCKALHVMCTMRMTFALHAKRCSSCALCACLVYFVHYMHALCTLCTICMPSALFDLSGRPEFLCTSNMPDKQLCRICYLFRSCMYTWVSLLRNKRMNIPSHLSESWIL